MRVPKSLIKRRKRFFSDEQIAHALCVNLQTIESLEKGHKCRDDIFLIVDYELVVTRKELEVAQVVIQKAEAVRDAWCDGEGTPCEWDFDTIGDLARALDDYDACTSKENNNA